MNSFEMLEHRLNKIAPERAKWAKKENISAYRLYDRDIPQIPITIDVYKNYWFTKIYPSKKHDPDPNQRQKRSEEILDILESISKKIGMGLEFRIREKQKGGLSKFQKENSKESINLIVDEYNLKFHVNLSDYSDTGLFLDHRPLRKMIENDSKSKRVLNLFSYTGALSLSANIGGAIEVTSVDHSSIYLDWHERNIHLNQLEHMNHNLIEEDVLGWIADQKNHNRDYDIIIADPPTFSNSKGKAEDWDIQRDYELFMIDLFRNFLSPGGKIYFSTNYRDFKSFPSLVQFFEKNYYKWDDISLQSIPKDFRDKKIHHLFVASPKIESRKTNLI
jgi:23S rRNA (cytosine1962-C5)-methyltransferase